MSFLQSIFDYSLKADRGKLGSRVAGAVARRLLRRSDSTKMVRYDVDGVAIDFPATHLTPHVWVNEPNNSKSLGRVAGAVARKYPDSVIVDVGANIGDSAAIIRSAGVDNRILAIEGVDRFYSVLKSNAVSLGNVEPIKCLVGTSEASDAVSVKVLDSGNAVVSVGTMAPANDGEWTAAHVQFQTLAGIVAEHAPTAAVKLVKTDIEGYDLPVLHSSMGFIASHKPVIFLELHVSDDDERRFGVGWKTLFTALASAGYDRAFYWHNSGDLLALIRLDDTEGLQVLNEYYRNRKGLMYADVCLVHASDADVANDILAGEMRVGRAMRPAATVR